MITSFYKINNGMIYETPKYWDIELIDNFINISMYNHIFIIAVSINKNEYIGYINDDKYIIYYKIQFYILIYVFIIYFLYFIKIEFYLYI
jgi:hypothetical protein